MPTLTIEYSTDAERLVLEQAIAYITPMRHLAATAPDGIVLAACEQLAFSEGRALLRDNLAAAVPARANTPPPKKSRHAQQRATPALDHAGRRLHSPGPPLVTGSDGGAYPADATLGVAGYLTAAATCMAVLAGTRQSFAHAEQLLRELSGWTLDDDTIRQATHTAAARATATRDQRAAAERFAAAAGVIEVPIDAGKVNTTVGWRDVKVAVFARRKEGEPATPAQWDERAVSAAPAPTTHQLLGMGPDTAPSCPRNRKSGQRDRQREQDVWARRLTSDSTRTIDWEAVADQLWHSLTLGERDYVQRALDELAARKLSAICDGAEQLVANGTARQARSDAASRQMKSRIRRKAIETWGEAARADGEKMRKGEMSSQNPKSVVQFIVGGCRSAPLRTRRQMRRERATVPMRHSRGAGRHDVGAGRA
jgi:hypothetical protein